MAADTTMVAVQEATMSKLTNPSPALRMHAAS